MKSEHLFIKNDKGGARLKTARAKIGTARARRQRFRLSTRLILLDKNGLRIE